MAFGFLRLRGASSCFIFSIFLNRKLCAPAQLKAVCTVLLCMHWARNRRKMAITWHISENIQLIRIEKTRWLLADMKNEIARSKLVHHSASPTSMCNMQSEHRSLAHIQNLYRGTQYLKAAGYYPAGGTFFECVPCARVRLDGAILHEHRIVIGLM